MRWCFFFVFFVHDFCFFVERDVMALFGLYNLVTFNLIYFLKIV